MERTQKIAVIGMSCAHCEASIQDALKEMPGVLSSQANASRGSVKVTYDPAVVDQASIESTIKQAGAGFEIGVTRRYEAVLFIGVGILLFALYLVFERTIGTTMLPRFDQTAAYGALFVIGLFTSIHCIGMCGGINIAQSVKYTSDKTTAEVTKEKRTLLQWLGSTKPSLIYNAGRVFSYTVIGGIVGAIGSVIQFTGGVRGIVAIVSGAMMVIVGLNLLNALPWVKKITPKLPQGLAKKMSSLSQGKGPFVIGVFNGFMPCGPLQAMQLSALGAGSAFAGAASMFFFSIGTVPLMFAIGAVSSLLSGRFTVNMMRISGVLVIGMGLVMASRGLLLSGLPPIPFL